MSRNPKLHTEMGYHVKRDRAIASDGTEFPFSPHSAKDRRAAIAKAVEQSNAHGKTMEAQAGRPLTRSERHSGKHDAPPAEKSVPRSLKKEKDPDAAFSAAVESVRKSPAHTTQQQQVRDARLAAMERVAAKREEKRIEAELAAAHFADPDTQKMIQAAESLQEAARRDPTTPPSTLRAIDNLVRITQTQVGLTKEGYFAMLKGAGLAKPDPEDTARDNGLNEDVTQRLKDKAFSQPGDPTND